MSGAFGVWMLAALLVAATPLAVTQSSPPAGRIAALLADRSVYTRLAR